MSRSGAFASQADITWPSFNKATAGVVTNQSLVSANRPRTQGEFLLTWPWPYGGTSMRAIRRKSSFPAKSRDISWYFGIAIWQSWQSWWWSKTSQVPFSSCFPISTYSRIGSFLPTQVSGSSTSYEEVIFAGSLNANIGVVTARMSKARQVVIVN